MPGLVRPPSTRLLKLEIENFKSYKGKQDIGPFHSFTAVIGPNGSGKSNLMDAISFVLGVKGAQLRGSLKELLYSHSADPQSERPTSGYVKLVLEGEDGEVSTFRRAINQNQSNDTYHSTYAIDGRTVTWTAYEDKLKSIGILVKARNFLVFQGDIEAIASKQATELTKVFEAISGSDAYKTEFDALEMKRKEAQDHLAYVQSKKKNTAAEKRQKKEQKAEAEKHLKLQQELDQLKSTYFLWQLYHLKNDKIKARDGLQAPQEILKAAAIELKAIDKQKLENKKFKAGLEKKSKLLDKKIKEQMKRADKENPDHQKAEIEVKNLREKVKKEEKALKQEEEKENVRQREIADLEAQLEQLRAVVEEASADDALLGHKLDASIKTELEKVKEQAKTRTLKAQTELDRTVTSKDSVEADLRDQKNALEGIEANIQIKKRKIADEAGRKGGQQEEIDNLRRDVQAQEEEVRNLKHTIAGIGAKRETILERQRRANDKLANNQRNQKEAKRDRERQKVVSDLKRLFKGVHGKLAELGEVTHDSYKLALTVIMTNDIDSIVVDNEETAKECVTYLKKQQIAPMTFLPLQTIKVRQPSERLRQIGGTAKLAIDLVSFKPQLEKAFMSACGATIVCDSENEARHIAFGMGDRNKVVTKSGLLFAKSGAMTGGGTQSMQRKLAEMDSAQLMLAREEIVKSDEALKQLDQELDLTRDQHRLERLIFTNRSKIAMLEKEIGSDISRTSGLEKELEPLEDQALKTKAEIESLSAQLEKMETSIARTAETIKKTKDKIFADISKKAGMDIQEYLAAHEERDNKADEEANRKLVQVARQEARLAAKQRQVNNLDMIKNRLQVLRDKFKEKEEALQKFEKAAKEALQNSEGQAEELAEIKKAMTEANEQKKSLEKAEKIHTTTGSEARDRIASQETELESLEMKQDDILKTAALEQVDLPKIDHEDEEMEEDGNLSSVDKEVARLDESKLNRQQRNSGSKESREKIDADFKQDIEARKETLARVAPNLKAVDQYEDAKNKDDKERAELETARQQNSDAQNQFHTIRQQRSDAFMAAFDHIKDVIDPIYKDLTKSQMHPLGGTAYLNLMSADVDPFLSGVSFTAMPPSKRWRQMEALSGGEKTVAALALLFAMHSFQPSPFFILDEVDAALDAVNVSKVANYIRERTRDNGQASDFQAIVISLKDYFFSKADALVGVTKAPGSGNSLTFTLDLTKYPETEQ